MNQEQPKLPVNPTHPLPPTQPESSVSIPRNPSIRDLFEILLRRPAQLAGHSICEEKRTLYRFSLIALLSFLVFGFVLGTFAYDSQIWAAPLKMGLGLFFAGLICFPSLYIFSILSGSNATVMKMAILLTGMLGIAGLLLLGFAPALWIFAQSTSSFGFMGLLAFGAWMVALIFAFRFLRAALRETGASQNAPIIIWCSIFILVTFQLSTTLRPILGTSDRFLNTEKRFFLQHWGESMNQSLKK